MKTEFLQNLKVGDQPLSKEVIDAIMAENGRDIEAAKKPYADYDHIKEQLDEAQKTIKGFQDADIIPMTNSLIILNICEVDFWGTIGYNGGEKLGKGQLAMTFSQWLFGGINNPFQAGQWGPLHIGVMVSCVVLILLFGFFAKHSGNPERTKRIILYALVGAIAFFEVMIRFVQCVKLYYLHLPEMDGINMIWIILPKPWCAISCWALIASVFIKKRFFYNYASLSALLCSVVFFVYPGVGFNNVHLLFENWYSILTHALLLTTSITMMVLGYTDFKYREIWKLAICFLLTFAYALIEIYVLHIQTDPMYFMPDGDIQADILKLDYGVYLAAYIAVFLIYVNVAHILDDKDTVKQFFAKGKIEEKHQSLP